MAIITTYPNVPLITTNAATDSIRQDNEHKPNIMATEKVTKPHAEREIDPEKEHPEQQHQTHQEQADDAIVEPSDNADDILSDVQPVTHSPANSSLFSLYKPALSRTDIKIIANDAQTLKTHSESCKSSASSEQIKAEHIQQNLKNVYDDDKDKPESYVNTWS